MIFTLKWLKEYLSFESNVEELCERLTSLGLEVEKTNNPKKNFNGLKVAKIESIRSQMDRRIEQSLDEVILPPTANDLKGAPPKPLVLLIIFWMERAWVMKYLFII